MIVDYTVRIADSILARRLEAWPAEFITGPRAVGKTTTALRYARAVVRLDRPAEQGPVLDVPDLAIRRTVGLTSSHSKPSPEQCAPGVLNPARV